MMNLSSLPLEIVSKCILPMTYSPQSNELCEDIRSFYNVKGRIYTKYRSKYPPTAQTYEGESAEDWLENDLTRFLNDDTPTMYGIKEQYIKIYSRLFTLKNQSNERVLNRIFISSSGYKELVDENNDINTIIAILTVDERIKLVEFMNSINFGEPI